MTDVANDRTTVATFACSRAALRSGTGLDDVAARAHELGSGATTMVSVAVVSREGTTRFDIWPESDPAVVHARVPDENDLADGLTVQRAALPYLLASFITRATGPWPVGRDGEMDAVSIEALTDAVADGTLAWTVVATRAERSQDHTDLEIVASTGSSVVAGVATPDGFPTLIGTPVSVALGRILTLAYTADA